MNKKLRCCCDSRSYCVVRTTYGILANYQTWFRLQAYERKHDPIQRAEFMNAPKLYLFKRDH